MPNKIRYATHCKAKANVMAHPQRCVWVRKTYGSGIPSTRSTDELKYRDEHGISDWAPSLPAALVNRGHWSVSYVWNLIRLRVTSVTAAR